MKKIVFVAAFFLVPAFSFAQEGPGNMKSCLEYSQLAQMMGVARLQGKSKREIDAAVSEDMSAGNERVVEYSLVLSEMIYGLPLDAVADSNFAARVRNDVVEHCMQY